MFEKASLRLTGWYLLILMTISIVFSFLVYQSATSEISARFSAYMTRIEIDGQLTNEYEQFRIRQLAEARHNILLNLIYINGVIALAGGVASFFLARQTLQPIQEAHENESRFVSDASHELRTPLAIMKTEIEVMLSDPNAPKRELRELLSSNLEEVNKLTKLATTLLSLSKGDYASLSLEPLNLNELITSATDRFAGFDRIKTTVPKQAVFVRGNSLSLEELLVILIDNALKYSPPDTPITLTLAKRPTKCVITVKNQGEGIATIDLPHIFDRFYRADTSRTSSDETSFGLGLALARQIVNLHDGSITATSTPKKHTTFSVSLPVVSPKNH